MKRVTSSNQNLWRGPLGHADTQWHQVFHGIYQTQPPGSDTMECHVSPARTLHDHSATSGKMFCRQWPCVLSASCSLAKIQDIYDLHSDNSGVMLNVVEDSSENRTWCLDQRVIVVHLSQWERQTRCTWLPQQCRDHIVGSLGEFHSRTDEGHFAEPLGYIGSKNPTSLSSGV